MIIPETPKTYMQQLCVWISGCKLIPRDERHDPLPRAEFKTREMWVVGCGRQYDDVTSQNTGSYRFQPQGTLEVFIRIKRDRDYKRQEERTKIVECSLVFRHLSPGDAGIESLRYDFDPGNAQPWRRDWDDDVRDNVAHPAHHLHVNFHHSKMANEVRLAAGPVSPLLILKNFEFWYSKIHPEPHP